MGKPNDRFAHYAAAKQQLVSIEKTFHRTMIANLIIAGFVGFFSIAAIAYLPQTVHLEDLDTDHYDDPGKIFQIGYAASALNSMGASIILLISLAVIVIFAILTAGKLRWASIALLAVYGLAAVFMLLLPVPGKPLFLLFYAVGFFLSLRCFMSFHELKELQKLEGYPHFHERLACQMEERAAIHQTKPAEAAPMEQLSPVETGLTGLPPDHSLDSLYRHPAPPEQSTHKVNLRKESGIHPVSLKKQPRNLFSDRTVPLDGIQPPVLAELTETKSKNYAPQEQALPTLEEIRIRYGQKPAKAENGENSNVCKNQ